MDRVIFGHIINVLCHFTGTKKRIGTVVHPETPRTEEGLYWGYQVRLAKSLGAVFVECPFTDGYDLTIGTSERGESVDALQFSHFKLVGKHLLFLFLKWLLKISRRII